MYKLKINEILSIKKIKIINLKHSKFPKMIEKSQMISINFLFLLLF